ncbi:MAG: tape measure protein [Mesorhizobium sp.]
MEVAGLVKVKVQADLSEFDASLAEGRAKSEAFDRAASRSFQGIGRSAQVAGAAAKAANDNIAGSAARAAAAYDRLHTMATLAARAIGTVVGAAVGAALIRLADAWSDLSARIGVAIKSMDGAGFVMERLSTVARRTYSDLNLTVESFLAVNATLSALGATTGQTLDYVEALNLALVVSGAKGERAAAVQDALSRAMALGKLSGDQLNTVIMSGGEVVELLARQLGVSTLKLRELGAEGKITRDVIYNAMVKSLDELREKAELMPATIGDGLTLIRNALLETMGVFDQAGQMSAGFASALVAIADNMDRVVAYGATAVAMFGTYYVAAFIAANAATVTLAGSLAFLRAALIRTGIGIAVVAAGELVHQFAKLVEETGSLGGALAEMGKRGEILLDAFVWVFRGTSEAITAIWYGAMADILRATEDAFGAILRLFGITAEAMQASITKYQKLAAQMGDVSKSSFIIAGEQFGRVFEDLPGQADEAADGILKFSDANEEASKAYTDLMARARERIEQMKLELTLVGKAGAETEALRFEQDLLSQVMLKNGKIAPEQRQAIHALALEYGRLAQAIAEARMASDLMFAQEQLGRSDLEQRVAEAMRSLYGDDYGKYMDSALAGQVRYIEKLKETRAELNNVNDAVKDTFVGLIDLLYQSGDATEKLIGAFAQLGKMFAQIGAEKLYDFISGKSSSLFGGSVPSVGGSASVANYRVSGQAIGETIAPPIVDSLNSGLDTYAAAIRKIESGSYGGNYGAQGQVVTSGMYAGDRAYGAYQIMGNNIASWTKEVLGQSMTISQFLGDKMAQDKVFYAKFGQSVDKYGSVADAISVWFSGRPLSRAGNASDGYNTVPEYVSKVQSAADAYPGGLAKAVSDGTVDASKRIRVGNSLQQNVFDTSSSTSVAGGGMTKMQGLLGVGGAAFGAFAGGYQSGDPISGAIGGAMAGLGATSSLSALGLGAAAGPVGIIGGAIIGLIGGLLGKAKQKKQEMKQAQQELESQMGAITQLIATATGNFMGSFEKSFTSTTDEFQKAIALAEKAGNKVMVEKLKSSMDEFFGTLQDQWDRGFEGVLASMNAGLGFDGEFVKGSDAVEKMRESLVGFVNDAKFFASANGDLSSMLDARKSEYGIGTTQQTLYRYQPQYREAGSEGSWVDNELTAGYLDIANQMVDLGVAAFTRAGGQLYPTLEALKRAATDAGLAIDEQGKVTRELKAANDNLADSVERAREGAQATALAMLSGGKEFTEVEKAIQRLEGAAATLPSLLDDLGMSAEEAAKAIEHHLNIALRDLRNNLTTDLTRSINDLAGFGYLNDLLDAQTAYESRVRDLQALGMDTGLAMQELGLRLANIAKEAELTDDQLTQLAAVFPQLGGSLMGLIGAGSTGTAAAVADAKAKLDDAKADLRRAYEEEASRLNQVISRHEAFIKSIQKFKGDLKLDSNLSPYDPYQRLQEAQRQFQETATAALGGDEDALGRIEDVSRSYLEEARSYYGTSEAYFSIFNDVQSLLDQALAVSNSSLSEAQQQLAALKEQTSALIDIDDSVMSVADAVAALTAAEAANAAAIAARDAQQAQLFQQMLGLLQQTGQAYDPFVSSLYRDVLGRAPDAEGAAYYTNMLNSGMSQDAVRAQFIANAQPELARGYPLYAGGGDFGGGLRIVGERGPELEMTGPSRIWSASDTSRILSQAWQAQSYGASNDNGNGELLREVKALREQNAKLLERLIGVSATGAQVTAAAARETSQAVRDQTKAARLERRQKVA